MSMGVPVVSTNLGGVPEVVIDGETGYMVTPGDVEGMAAGIQKLWSDQSAYKLMGENAREMMKENFDKETQFDRFLEYFHSLV
jgi:glycosyltransferase involved in cell wall biosynthesis